MNDKFKDYTIEGTINFPGHVCPVCADLLPETSQISTSTRAQVTGLRAEVRQLTDEELLAVPGSAGKIAADVFCISPLCEYHEVAFVSLDVAIAAALGWRVSTETPRTDQLGVHAQIDDFFEPGLEKERPTNDDVAHTMGVEIWASYYLGGLLKKIASVADDVGADDRIAGERLSEYAQRRTPFIEQAHIKRLAVGRILAALKVDFALRSAKVFGWLPADLVAEAEKVAADYDRLFGKRDSDDLVRKMGPQVWTIEQLDPLFVEISNIPGDIYNDLRFTAIEAIGDSIHWELKLVALEVLILNLGKVWPHDGELYLAMRSALETGKRAFHWGRS